jgi:translocation and assembly module TamA
VSGRAEPTMLVGDENLPYLRLQAQGSFYYSLDKLAKSVVAARMRVGSIIHGSIPEIPASRRFYAGGGGSVRGFGYQDVGPRLSDGTPMGGLSLMEASVEMRRDLFGPWGVAVFADAGTVSANRIPGFHNLAVGAGVGVRYNLAFGPIRVDVATPVTHRRDSAAYQIYVSIGQAF